MKNIAKTIDEKGLDPAITLCGNRTKELRLFAVWCARQVEFEKPCPKALRRKAFSMFLPQVSLIAASLPMGPTGEGRSCDNFLRLTSPLTSRQRLGFRRFDPLNTGIGSRIVKMQRG